LSKKAKASELITVFEEHLTKSIFERFSKMTEADIRFIRRFLRGVSELRSLRGLKSCLIDLKEFGVIDEIARKKGFVGNAQQDFFTTGIEVMKEALELLKNLSSSQDVVDSPPVYVAHPPRGGEGDPIYINNKYNNIINKKKKITTNTTSSSFELNNSKTNNNIINTSTKGECEGESSPPAPVLSQYEKHLAYEQAKEQEERKYRRKEFCDFYGKAGGSKERASKIAARKVWEALIDADGLPPREILEKKYEELTATRPGTAFYPKPLLDKRFWLAESSVWRVKRQPKPFVAPTLEEVITYFKQKGLKGEFAEKKAGEFMQHYEPRNWVKVNGKPVDSWEKTFERGWLKSALEEQKVEERQKQKSEMSASERYLEQIEKIEERQKQKSEMSASERYLEQIEKIEERQKQVQLNCKMEAGA